MSTLPENELDLEKLFLPAWAQESSSAKHYAQYEGEDKPDRRDDRRGRRPARREGPPGERQRENRPSGDRRGPPRAEGDRRRSFGGEKPEFRREDQRERREPPPPLPDINLSLVPEETGVEFLARQIKMTGRAYPLFDIARLILQKPERHAIAFSVQKKPDGQIAQPLFVCVLDDTLWLSEDEAVAHVLKKHFTTFYQAERTATEPPKGKYTFVAQCGMSGVILGPPNYHDYQNQLRKLHAQRFSRMPFDAFKSRVRIVRDEEVVKKWVDDQSWTTEYICLNIPEPIRLGSMADVEKHFRETHKDTIIKPVESHTLNGVAAHGLRSPDLARLVRQACEDQRRFPLQIATVLSQQFASHGLQFFKVNKTFTHVSVARPHFLDLEVTPVSEGVKRIVEYINANPKCTRRKLMESLAPSPPPPPPAPIQIEGQGDAPKVAAPEPAAAEATPEQTAVVSDLHWLIHQGHVIEFASGILETAKRPLPKPPKPEAKPAEQPVEAQLAGEAAAPTDASVEQPASAEPAVVSSEAAPPVGDVSPAPAPEEEPAPVTPTAEETPVETPAAPAGSPS
jgi:hypothetical protein